MAKAFSIRDFMGDDFRQQDSDADVYKKVSVYDVESNPENEYSLSEIEKMKDSIFALGGVQQNIVVVEFPDGVGGKHKYLALDGHRRLLASRELVEEGRDEFEFIPAVIKGKLEAGMDEAVLIMMNSTQRNKTDWEKVMEHMKLKEIIPKLKKRQGIDGRTRDIEADMLGVSRTQVNIYNTIGTRLSEDLMEMFRIGSIGISLAYEAAKQDACIQDQIVELINQKGSIGEEDIRQLSGSRVCDGQQELPNMIPSKNVSESDTFKESEKIGISSLETQCDTKDIPPKENVSESDTFEIPSKLYGTDLNGENAVTAEEAPEESDGNQTKQQGRKFRGGYEPILIEDLAKEYASYLEMAISENRDKQICKYNCLLDALDLLAEKLNVERGNNDL